MRFFSFLNIKELIKILKIFVDINPIENHAVIMVVDGHDPLYSKVVEMESLQYTLHQTVKELSDIGKEIRIHGEILEKNYFD